MLYSFQNVFLFSFPSLLKSLLNFLSSILLIILTNQTSRFIQYFSLCLVYLPQYNILMYSSCSIYNIFLCSQCLVIFLFMYAYYIFCTHSCFSRYLGCCLILWLWIVQSWMWYTEISLRTCFWSFWVYTQNWNCWIICYFYFLSVLIMRLLFFKWL